MSLAEFRGVPPEDRELFVRWMVELVRADGMLDPAELAVVHELVSAWGLPIDRLMALHRSLREGPELGEGAPPGFLDPRTPYLLVKTLIQLGHEDGVYADDERAAVQRFADRYRVPRDRVEALEEWVARDVAHQSAGRELVVPAR